MTVPGQVLSSTSAFNIDNDSTAINLNIQKKLIK